MRGAIPQLPQYAFMAWCSVKKKKAQGQLYLYLLVLVLVCDLTPFCVFVLLRQ